MQFTLDASAVVMAVLGALWSVCLAAVGVWVKRVQSDAESDRRQIGLLQKNLADFREMVARECASRDEVRNERQEVRELLARIDAKIDSLSKTVPR
ncbi:hypothetical protein KY49_3308 [Burkholderia sp. MSHR3999]|uniref:hypothetical protein n=1 Tax=Burkholderia TaxID=32008 RepID=UPI0005B7428E|nr:MULTISPECIES: hypothetical protein [Burkholderia]KIP19806.1 hypothetical protein KY49_3308 [Burkholderia sp. MSHR3999]